MLKRDWITSKLATTQAHRADSRALIPLTSRWTHKRQQKAIRKEQEACSNAYLSQPQQWNRYSYGINNPLLYVDPTGEAIQLSKDKDERERQMQALREAVGSEAAQYLYVNQGTNPDGSANYYVPGSVMSDRKDNMLTPSVIRGHELGHARDRMTGYRDRRGNRDAIDGSLRLENKIRKLQFPNGPTRKTH